MHCGPPLLLVAAAARPSAVWAIDVIVSRHCDRPVAAGRGAAQGENSLQPRHEWHQ